MVDVFDALTTRRPYKEALPERRALDILEELSGKELDARVVSTLRETHECGEFEAELAFSYCLTH